MKQLLNSLISIFIGLCLMSCECENYLKKDSKDKKSIVETHKVTDPNPKQESDQLIEKK
jgi:hypothetical protein